MVGFTFFGLIEQDESLPPQLLKELGIKGARYKVAEYRTERHDEPSFQVPSARMTGFHTLGVRQLSRDVIGVNKVGYVLA